MGSSGSADNVEGLVHIGDPVAKRLVHGVFERARAGCHRYHFRAQQFHAEHVGCLTFNVFRAHIDNTRQTKARGNRCGSYTMLTSACLSDDAGLAHAPRQLDLSQAIIDLVAARMVQLVAFEIDLCAAAMLGKPLSKIERTWTACIVLGQIIKFCIKGRVLLCRLVVLLKVEDQWHQGLGNKASAENTEMAILVRPCPVGIELLLEF